MDDVFAALLGILRDHRVVIDPENPDVELAEAGVDSLIFVDLVLAIERHFDVRFQSEQISPETFRTPQTITDAVISLKDLASNK